MAFLYLLEIANFIVLYRVTRLDNRLFYRGLRIQDGCKSNKNLSITYINAIYYKSRFISSSNSLRLKSLLKKWNPQIL
jgi:hypothetical protein